MGTTSNYYRIFFSALEGHKFILLHAILKKADKTPEGDKRLALQRLIDYQSRS